MAAPVYGLNDAMRALCVANTGEMTGVDGLDWDAKLAALEQQARALDPEQSARRALDGPVSDYAHSFLDGLPGGQTYTRDAGASDRLDTDFAEDPTTLASLLENLAGSVDTPGINPASGGHLGYIPGGGLYPSALGDYLADVANRYSGVEFASPGAVRMERELVRWMSRLIGFPDTAGGDLTSGGSLANLAAIVAAREAFGIGPDRIATTCIYTTRQVHHCVDKALRVAGLDHCPLRYVPMDERHRMDADALDELAQADERAGLHPWLVVASAGTTDTGAVDPLLRIASVSRKQGLWLHVDAAYGGFFLLCEEGRESLPGLDRADSVVMDPHKGLFLPYGTGAVLVRDVRHLAQAHRYHADYMQDATAEQADFSPADLSAELSRPFRGLRLWMPLKLFGLRPFRAALAEKLWLARYFHEAVGRIPGIVAGPYPDLSVVTFRFEPQGRDDEAFNREVLKAVQQDGRIFISSTRLNGQFTLRAAILHFRTHKAEVDHLLGLLCEQSSRLAPDQSSPSQ